MKINLSKTGGYSLVEMLVYLAVLIVIMFVVVNTVVSFSTAYREIKALRLVEHSAQNVMERITRDIRSADGVITAQSTLGSSPGVLTLTSTVNSVTTVTKFYIDNNVLKVDVNGAYFGPLSGTDARVTNLVFRHHDSGVSEAVRIDMTVEATVGIETKIKTYHSTVILKGQ